MAWSTSDRRERLPADWDKIRAAILRRDGYQCTHRDDYGKRCIEAGTDVDHIRRGDDHRSENLRVLCRWHHNAKSSAEGGEARAIRDEQIDQRWRRTEDHPGTGDGVSRRRTPRPPRG